MDVTVKQRALQTVGQQPPDGRDGLGVGSLGALEQVGDLKQFGLHGHDPVTQQQTGPADEAARIGRARHCPAQPPGYAARIAPAGRPRIACRPPQVHQRREARKNHGLFSCAHVVRRLNRRARCPPVSGP
jgi:hypothetical protein